MAAGTVQGHCYFKLERVGLFLLLVNPHLSNYNPPPAQQPLYSLYIHLQSLLSFFPLFLLFLVSVSMGLFMIPST